MLRIVRRDRPPYVIAENVSEAAIAKAAADLAGPDYATYYRRISGTDCGADHQRDRWWAFAYPHAQGELRRAIDAEVAKLPSLCAGLWGAENYSLAIRIPERFPDRVDGPGPIGNAVIPQIPEAIGRAIMKVHSVRDPSDSTKERALLLTNKRDFGEAKTAD
jgi:hypothetical protein